MSPGVIHKTLHMEAQPKCLLIGNAYAGSRQFLKTFN